MVRLRYDRSTKQNLQHLKKIDRLGKIHEVRGYRYRGRYGATHEAVLVKGEHGSVRFGGMLWGYSGEGPRATIDLLNYIAPRQQWVYLITEHKAFARREDIGIDWIIQLSTINTPNPKTGRSVTYLASVVYVPRKEIKKENWAYLVSKV